MSEKAALVRASIDVTIEGKASQIAVSINNVALTH